MQNIKANSLLVKCTVAAAIYYLPQDIGVLSLLSLNKRSHSKQVTGPISGGPAESKLDDLILRYMMDRGFDPSGYVVTKGRRNTVVQLR
ncbi:hypothetical protein BgAZ_502940 [Babesia gibsoni]|uniref:Uncharacterized protein n=1 Tax=Babesia gibsoni TaxID=33632 RepID=A0AAD8PD92_BABGI|nr:hypothetical protein BgAZ_502940 [Babesia gibsoni]